MIAAWAMAAIVITAGSEPPASTSPPPAVESTPAAPATTAVEAAAFERRLEAVDAAMAGVVDLRADFEQRRHTPLLKRPLTSKGVVVSMGDRVRWDTTAPRPSSLVVGGGSISVYYPEDRLLEAYPVNEGFRDMAGGPLPRLSELRKRFDIAPLTPGAGESGEKVLEIRLTPKSEELRAHVESIEVVIDEARPAARRVTITDPDGERTEIDFRNVRLNTGVKVGEVELKVPPGTRVSRPLGDTSSGDAGGPSGSGRGTMAEGERP